MRYTGPKNRLARREGQDLGLKTPGTKSYSNLLRRINIPPGQHQEGMFKRRSEDYLSQLREKQKLKRMYGLTEKQLKNYFKKASAKKENTASFLYQLLERRLDNVVYLLGFAPTRSSARQLVSHGHIKVNDKTVNIPSYLIEVNDIISFKKEKSTKIPYVEAMLEKKDLIIPHWLKREGIKGQVLQLPKLEDRQGVINYQLVIEFYSR